MPPLQTQMLFDQRFLGRYVGPLMSDPATALVELVANCWDAYATRVEIQWPNRRTQKRFSITDNGHGMTQEEFDVRWHTLEYDRVSYQGDRSPPPPEKITLPPRLVYGRNGRHYSLTAE
jgi:Histidine kinase-, DNA gyrase B-, and HSP90-like ATPase